MIDGDSQNAILNYKERMIGPEFAHCRADAGRLIIRQDFYASAYSEILQLTVIALTMLFSTSDAERGFSGLKRIKTKQRNKLLGSTPLCSMLRLMAQQSSAVTTQRHCGQMAGSKEMVCGD